MLVIELVEPSVGTTFILTNQADAEIHWPDKVLKRVNRCAVRASVVDLEEPEGKSKWGFVSGYETGLRHRHDSLPKSKESQIRALEEGRHQHSSSAPS